LLTAEEFFRLPEPQDGSRQELVRGVVVTTPPSGGRHGACCSRIDRRIGNYVDDRQSGTVCTNNTGFISERDPDSVRGPDVAYWSRERLPEVPTGYIEVSPDLAVEVVSPGDHYSRIQKIVKDFLEKGVRLVWVADPEDRSVTVYRPGQMMVILSENDTLTGEDVLPGFSYRVGDLFPERCRVSPRIGTCLHQGRSSAAGVLASRFSLAFLSTNFNAAEFMQ
jgi:Uma2 family endonuclease